jgi:ERCC4-type nuclease
MNQLLLCVDYRERWFIDKLNEQYTQNPLQNNTPQTLKINNVDIQIVVRALEVGDFLIYDGDELLLLVERKTVADLCASITDGRFRQQKE